MKKNNKILFVLQALTGLLLLLPLGGCPMRGPTVPPPATGVLLSEVCAHYNVTWQWDGVTQVVILEYRGNKAKALVGSNVVLVGKEKMNLSAPLRRAHSAIYVPEDFEAQVLVPLGITPGVPGLKTDSTRLRIHTIVLDPGHGGKDPGAEGVSRSKEKTVVLDIAKRLRLLLEEAGIKVIMTRSTDEFISLPGRTEIASRPDTDLFVSIHANSNPARKTEGMEVYYVKTATKRDLDEEQRQKNEKMFADKLNMQPSPALTGIVGDMMYSLKTAESRRLAQALAQECSASVETPNRGARSARYFVVRNTLTPAVLIEVGFLTNRREERKLKSPVYRQKMAEAIARSILAYATSS